MMRTMSMLEPMRRFSMGLATACAALAAGCLSLGQGTPPTRYYVLSGLEDREDVSPGATEGGGAAVQPIGIGPVAVSPIVDRPQIVTPLDGHEIALSEYDRWAEPTSDGIVRVLAVNLAVLLRNDGVFPYPWGDTTQVATEVRVVVRRFQGAPGGTARLDASWSILRGQEVFRTKRSSFRRPVASDGYDGVVAALSGCLEDLSEELAKAIRELP